jgi:CspA family cold shock protein
MRRPLTVERSSEKSFDHRRGFGFITPDDGGPDVHVYVSAVERSGLARVSPGDKVAFELQKDTAQDRMTAVKLSFV